MKKLALVLSLVASSSCFAMEQTREQKLNELAIVSQAIIATKAINTNPWNSSEYEILRNRLRELVLNLYGSKTKKPHKKRKRLNNSKIPTAKPVTESSEDKEK